jgi:hypothetical protein
MVDRSTDKSTKEITYLINSENKNFHNEIDEDPATSSNKNSTNSNVTRKILDDDQLNNVNNKSRKRNRRRRQNKTENNKVGESFTKLPNEKHINSTSISKTPLEYQVNKFIVYEIFNY